LIDDSRIALGCASGYLYFDDIHQDGKWVQGNNKNDLWSPDWNNNVPLGAWNICRERAIMPRLVWLCGQGWKNVLKPWRNVCNFSASWKRQYVKSN
jgi:hypothetical protein